jgi:hypothetical protein
MKTGHIKMVLKNLNTMANNELYCMVYEDISHNFSLAPHYSEARLTFIITQPCHHHGGENASAAAVISVFKNQAVR